MTTRTAWECPRCHRMNAPHVDHCDCAARGVELVPPRTPVPPLVPYDWIWRKPDTGTIAVTSPTTYGLPFRDPNRTPITRARAKEGEA